MLEPDDLMDSRHDEDCASRQGRMCNCVAQIPKAPTELDQLAALSNAVLMLSLAAHEIEDVGNGNAMLLAASVRRQCEGWRENINQRLRLINR